MNTNLRIRTCLQARILSEDVSKYFKLNKHDKLDNKIYEEMRNLCACYSSASLFIIAFDRVPFLELFAKIEIEKRSNANRQYFLANS